MPYRSPAHQPEAIIDKTSADDAVTLGHWVHVSFSDQLTLSLVSVYHPIILLLLLSSLCVAVVPAAV